MKAAFLGATLLLSDPTGATPPQPEPAGEAPPALVGALDRAGRFVRFAGRCARGRAERQAALALAWRVSELDGVVEALYGPWAAPAAAAEAPACAAGAFEIEARAAGEAVLEAERLVEAEEARMSQGLWFGSVHVCWQSIRSAWGWRLETGAPQAQFELRPAAATRIERLTTGLVGRDVLIRLDGRMVSRAPIPVPLSRTLLLGFSSREEMSRAVHGVRTPCEGMPEPP